ncbi:MAG: DUF1980 domain-containing protein [Rhodococcus sp.]|nr:DUF1980 domain-containing protein [Rhodococcus sp. (in: high G+C Gram-positive bacteria)]
MSFVNSFWDFLWTVLVIFAFIAYLILLFAIITDLFRDSKSSGWAKALWVIFLFIFPLITALVYLIAKGDGMAARSAAAERQAQDQQDSYIRNVAGTSPSAEIAHAKDLLDSGAISQSEYESLKAHALSKTNS